MFVQETLLKPEITFWECRVSERGILFQLLLEEIDEPVDAVIKFSREANNRISGGGKY